MNLEQIPLVVTDGFGFYDALRQGIMQMAVPRPYQ